MNDRTSDYCIGAAALQTDGSVWVASNKANVVMRFSIESFVVSEVVFIDELKSQNLFSQIIKYKEYIYLIPDNASTMWRVNTEDLAAEPIHIGLNRAESLLRNKFRACYTWKDRLYLFGFNVHGIVQYDFKSHSASRIDMTTLERGEDLSFGHFMVSDDNICYLPARESTDVIRFDCDNSKLDKIVLPNIDADYYNSACIFRREKYFTTNNDGLVVLDSGDRLIKNTALNLLPANGAKIYRRIIVDEDKIILIPSTRNTCFYMSEPGVYSSILIDNKHFRTNYDYTRYEFVFDVERKIYLQSRIDGEVYIFDRDTMSLEKHYISIDSEKIDAISEVLLKQSRIPVAVENVDMTLSNLVNSL